MWTAVFTIAVCAVLAVVGLIVGGVIPAESLPVPAGVLQAFQVSAPGIAKSDDMDENLSQKLVRDVRASHASTSSREEEKPKEKKEEEEEEEEHKKESKSKRRDDDDDDKEVVLLGHDERDFVAASKATNAESREPAAASKGPRRAGAQSLSADYDDARTRA